MFLGQRGAPHSIGVRSSLSRALMKQFLPAAGRAKGADFGDLIRSIGSAVQPEGQPSGGRLGHCWPRRTTAIVQAVYALCHFKQPTYGR